MDFIVTEEPLFFNMNLRPKFEQSNYHYFYRLSYKNQMTETIITKKSYSGQSLFGDVGGTVNMFLGICGIGIIKIMTSLTSSRKQLKKHVLRFSMFSYWLVFVYFTTQAVTKYLQQPITTQTHFEKKELYLEFPYLTFCARSHLFSFKPFYHQMQEQLEANIYTDFDELMSEKGWSYNIESVIIGPSISVKGQKTMLQLQNITSKSYHHRYGLCYTLDIRYIEHC